MARTRLDLVLRDLSASLSDALALVIATSQWRNFSTGPGIPPFKQKHYSTIVGLSYLQGFLAWEQFIEESFILYLLGKKSPSGFRPFRYAFPPNRKHAQDLAKGDRRFSDWTNASHVVEKAQRYFRDGKPYYDALRSRTNLLSEMKTIRNAITHRSSESDERFQALVRTKLTYYPSDVSPGGFLDTVVAGSSPPQRYLEYYFEQLEAVADKIVPRR